METPKAGKGVDVVIVYAFDCTTTTPAWNKMDEVYWLVHEKLTHFAGSCLGYVYVMSTPNTYTRNMKLVDAGETAATGHKESPLWRRTACKKNMASGLIEAYQLIRDHGNSNAGVILFFSDGSINKGDYFDKTETFSCVLPVHTFTLAGDAYNNVLHTLAKNSPRGTFNSVPDKPKQSVPFSQLLDNILSSTIKHKNDPIFGRLPKTVFIVYAFDSTTSTPAYKKVDEIFWMVHRKLIDSEDSCLGYICAMSTPNAYTLDMKVVDPADKDGSYKRSSVWRRAACTKNMASGLHLANELIYDHGRSDVIILFFSDGLINKGDFFDGVGGFSSIFPVHTFTVGGNAYNEVLRTIAENSPDGTFNPRRPVPDNPKQSAPFSYQLYSILGEKRPSHELLIRDLYLYRANAGPYLHQRSIFNADGSVTSGEIYEGVGPSATLVARLQGPNISAGDTSDMFRIVFEAERYNGSMLQIQEIHRLFGGHWNIIDGTGPFSMASGRIMYRFQERSDSIVIRFSIHASCPLWEG